MSHMKYVSLERRVEQPAYCPVHYYSGLPAYCQATGTKDQAEVMAAFMDIMPTLLSEPFMDFYAAILGKETSTDNSR